MSQVCIFLFVLLFTSIMVVSESANVLCMFTSPGKSHLIVYMAVAKALIERGHNLTVVTTLPIPKSDEMPVRHIHLDELDDSLTDLTESVAKLTHSNRKLNGIRSYMRTMKLLTGIQWDAMAHPKMKAFLAEDNHFELMVLGYFNNLYQVGIAARFRCPIAVISLGPPFDPINQLVGNPEGVSYVPMGIFGTDQPMTFGGRVKNVLFAMVSPLIQRFLDSIMDKYYSTMFPASHYPMLSEVIKNVSLVLCNSHFSEKPIRPLVPALVEIGGIQIKDKPDPLPKDIQDFIANKETILFSLGSTARGTDLKPYQVQSIFNVFRQLKQNVLWKWESDTELPGISANILYSKWLPQDDILAQPNLKLFITPGGRSSIIESQYHGVPMIGIPLFGDQSSNVNQMVNKGYGLQLDLTTLTELSLMKTITEVLENPIYDETVKSFSNLYRDRPMTAKETAAYWLEYIIRYNGARHMQSPAIELNVLQLSSIDVIATLFAILYVLVKLPRGLVWLVKRILLSMSKEDGEK